MVQSQANVLVDTGPDLRQQMLRTQTSRIDQVLYTHFHYDHMGGLDDLRPFTYHIPQPLDCYANRQTVKEIEKKYPYLDKSIKYPNIPRLNIREYAKNEDGSLSEMQVADIHIQPLRLLHIPDAGIESVGFVFNKKFAYLTDFKEIHADDEKFLFSLQYIYMGSPVDYQHPTHISQPEVLALMQKFSPQKGFIGHLSHQFLHTEFEDKWPENISPAHDMLAFEV